MSAPRFRWSPGTRLRDIWSRFLSPRLGILGYCTTDEAAVHALSSNKPSVELNILFKMWLLSVSFLFPKYVFDYVGKHLEPSSANKVLFAYLLQHW